MSESSTTHARNSKVRKLVLSVGSAIAVAALVFLLFGRDSHEAAGTPGEDGSDRVSEGSKASSPDLSAAPGALADEGDSGTEATHGKTSEPNSASANENGSSSSTSPSSGATNGGSVASAPNNSSPTDIVTGAVDTVTELANDAVGEIANQLGETVGTVEDTLGEVGVDLDAVTEDVLDLVEQGIPLEEAVDQVLGLLPPILPTPAPSGGGLGGLLGGLGL